jgi:hypothetical protein
LTGLFLVLFAVTNIQPACPDSLFCRAKYYFLNRHLGSGYLDSCMSTLARVRREVPFNEGCLALEAQAAVLCGQGATDAEQRTHWFLLARAAADALRKHAPEDPDGHLWWGIAQGSIVSERGGLGAALRAGDIRRSYERALALAPNNALANYAMARFCEEVPKWAGGGAAKAEAYFRRGIQADPDYTIVRLGLAELLIRERRTDDARMQLLTLLAVRRPTNPAEFALDDAPAARSLLCRFGVDQR